MRVRFLASIVTGAVMTTVLVPASAPAGGRKFSLDTPDALFSLEAQYLGYDHALEHLELRNQSRLGVSAPAEAAIAPADSTAPPEVAGQWSTVLRPATTIVAIHAVMLRTGKVLIYSGSGGQQTDDTKIGQAAVFDPVDMSVHDVHAPANIFCAGQTILADGEVLIVGGTLARDPKFRGLSTVFRFDPIAETWAQDPDTRHGRWYPSVATQADGAALILGGVNETGALNNDIELYTPGSSSPSQFLGLSNTGQYPKMHVLPDGKDLVIRSSNSEVMNPADGTSVSGVPLVQTRIQRPASVLLPGPVTGSWKVFLVGGKVSTTGNGLATTEIWDGSSATPHWTEDTPMPEARTHLNLVALPDGTVLGVGGAASGQVVGPTKQAILYDPTTHTWTGMATEAMRRAYHSTALLLPDGRVLSAGDSLTGGGRTTMEIFSPPYLFKGARPVITTAPEQVAYGQAFAVGSPDAVSRAVLVAPGANTHATDTHQRLLELPIAASGDGSGITTFAPPSGGAAPPGWYMLFLLNADGVPSIAKWVHVGDVGAPPPPEPTTTTVAPTTTSTTSLGG